uniref:Uncharacterized protein n=1 Tax=Arion vulgaris TaxID=1028688 RepID=A0A0B7BDX9_9EUPU
MHLKYPDGNTYNHTAPYGNTCSNYKAETKAIKTAIETAHHHVECKRDCRQKYNTVLLIQDLY